MADALFPPGGVLYRGTAFDEVAHSNFFKDAVGHKIRIPGFFPTSFDEAVARRFLGMAYRQGRIGVMFRVQVDPRGEKHPNYLTRNANLIRKRDPGLVNEFEYLFTQYSVFTVARFVPSITPDDRTPHLVFLRPVHDNLGQPEGLPLAPRS